jgi:hypothetical protein
MQRRLTAEGGLIFCSTPAVPPLALPRRVAPCKKHGTDIRLPFSYGATALLIRCDRDHKALNVAVRPRPPNPAGFIEERANRSNRVRRSEPCTAIVLLQLKNQCHSGRCLKRASEEECGYGTRNVVTPSRDCNAVHSSAFSFDK